jgi:hypothetical protein
MKYYGVEGHGDLVRDSHNNSIVNQNKSEYEKYLTIRNLKNKKSETVNNIEEELAQVKNDINEIKSLLKEVLRGS